MYICICIHTRIYTYIIDSYTHHEHALMMMAFKRLSYTYLLATHCMHTCMNIYHRPFIYIYIYIYIQKYILRIHTYTCITVPFSHHEHALVIEALKHLAYIHPLASYIYLYLYIFIYIIHIYTPVPQVLLRITSTRL